VRLRSRIDLDGLELQELKSEVPRLEADYLDFVHGDHLQLPALLVVLLPIGTEAETAAGAEEQHLEEDYHYNAGDNVHSVGGECGEDPLTSA